MPRRHRRTLFPMPVYDLFEHPKWVALPAAGRGMLISIIEHYWRSACAPLPITANNLYPLARSHNATWHTHRAEIMAIFAEVQPGLEAYHRNRSAGVATLKIASGRGGAATRARHTVAALQNSAPPPIAPTDLGIVPRREPPPTRPPAPDKRPDRPRLVDRSR